MAGYFYKNNKFIIDDYDTKKPFYSFLPGVAGMYGVPIWSFYLNRGQGIASFGVRDKDGPILEFSPAVVASERVSAQGFRTFLKFGKELYEPFAVTDDREGLSRRMYVAPASFGVSEKNDRGKYEIRADYCTLPTEDIGGLIRRVSVKNIGGAERVMEICDGITMLLPYGITNSEYKCAGNLLRSWAETSFIGGDILFTKQRASTADGSEIKLFDSGNFYLSESGGALVPPVADLTAVFGHDTSLRIPFGFKKDGAAVLEREQALANKIACGFTVRKVVLAPGEECVIHTLIGNACSAQALAEKRKMFLTPAYFEEKLRENERIVADMTSDVKTKTAFTVFDAYIGNCYLDNALRGGYPVLLGNAEKKSVFYIYSRKHGDMERDYNWFTIEPEFFSHGNGNYRDVNQNRRNDVLINPFMGEYNVKLFLSLIQADGYNPHNVKGDSFEIPNRQEAEKLVREYAGGNALLSKALSGKFTPGEIARLLCGLHIETSMSYQEFLSAVLSAARQNTEASFGEGYWTDHWTYCLDLIEAYERIFPDRSEHLLFTDGSYRYFYSPVYVRPRSQKYVLTKEGKPRQYAALGIGCDRLPVGGVSADINQTNWLRYESGTEVWVNLISKLFFLALIKFATLDCEGLGVEMEADRVGWNDAMNGLAGIFGSGMSETIELYRLLRYVKEKLAERNWQGVSLFAEQRTLLDGVLAAETEREGFAYWNRVSDLREEYRLSVAGGVCGALAELAPDTVRHAAEVMEKRLARALRRAKEIGGGLYPTYFYYEAEQYSPIYGENGEAETDAEGRPFVRVEKFKRHTLPLFLEAPARSYKIENAAACKKMHAAVRGSDLYDKNLGLYKTCESLEGEIYEIGRIKQFTPGHLERESCFLHMDYKYLLGLLKAGLYEEFFQAAAKNIVAFMDPAVYGRSTLENSSFIATSNNPDPAVVGQGFYARLTGANAEMLSMWHIMMFGEKPFCLENGELVCRLMPVLKGEFFDEAGEVSCTFLGKIQVVYKNPLRKDTFGGGCTAEKMILTSSGVSETVAGGTLRGERAEKLRAGKYEKIEIYLK